MPTASSSPAAPAPKPRVLSGGGPSAAPKPGQPATPATPGRTGSKGRTGDTTTFPATQPFQRTQAASPNRPAPRGAVPATEPSRMPRWLKLFVAGGLLLAIGMPASVLLGRSMLVQAMLNDESSSKAAMVCTGGDARAVDGSSVLGWLFGGSYFQCGEWETRDARQQRERDQYEANYLAKERARRQGQ